MSKQNYLDFIKAKQVCSLPNGFDVAIEDLAPESFGKTHQCQPHIIQWALKLGKSAIFASYGLGKTRLLLEWAKHITRLTSGKVLILASLAVARQTVREGEKFGIKAEYCQSETDILQSSSELIVINYDRLKSVSISVLQSFTGVVLDESAILKQYRGKTKEFLVSTFADTKYKLCCSANPSPNDYLELGNHVDFLNLSDVNGKITSHTMISRWFKNDTMKAGGYQLKPHAAKDFWEWMSSWSVCISKPSDLGFSDEGWDMPPHQINYHVVPVDHTQTWEETDRNGQLTLIRSPSLSATTTHKEARLNCDRLAQVIADIVFEKPLESWAIWCFTDYESEALSNAIVGAIELRGSEPAKSKEEKLIAFTEGDIRYLITKPEIAGLGLNWQHCANQVFMMGTSYSFEQLHQAMHRLYRFGQTRQVNTHLVYAETAGAIRQTIERKQRQFERMQEELRRAVRRSQLAVHQRQVNDDYKPTVLMTVPSWLTTKTA